MRSVDEVVVTDEGVTRRAGRMIRRNMYESIAWSELLRVEVVSGVSASTKDEVDR